MLLLTGCMVGPDYHAPDPVLTDRWRPARDPDLALLPVSAEDLKRWWQVFKDPVLDQLMLRAETGNLDLQIALSRVAQARAEWRANRADLLPRVTGVAAGAHQNNLLPFGSQAPQGLNYFLSGFDAVWEIDVFGRLRRKLEAATAQTDSALENYRQARVLLFAELARDYTEYRSLQNQQQLAMDNLIAWEHTREVSEKLLKAGLISRSELAMAYAETASSGSGLPALESQRMASEHQIELLLGTKPGGLNRLLKTAAAVPMSSVRALLTTPTETLRYRPDVRAAERELAAATATQGAAFAELFPKISIAAFLGFHNSDLENLFRSTAFSWASGTAITQPIFNFGRIRAGIDLADARQQEAWLNYEKTVLTALHETENALSQLLQEEQRRSGLALTVTALQQTLDLTDLRYREGLGSFLDVLVAQRSLYAAKLELTQSQARTTTQLIALYKALGGAGQYEIKSVDEPLRPWG